MSSMLTSVGLVVAEAVDWIGDFANLLADNPVLTLLCIGVPLVGLGIGLLKRMISL